MSGAKVYHLGISLTVCGLQSLRITQDRFSELHTAVGCNSFVPALAACLPHEGRLLCSVCEAEMEVSDGPVMRMCELPELYQGNRS